MKKKEVPRFKVDKEGMKKVGKGFLIGVGGLILTALQDMTPYIEFGDPMYSTIAMAINSTLVNLIRKFISKYQ